MNQDSGWRKRQIALDIKAENARELGLDYEPDKTIIEMAIQGHASTREAIWWAIAFEREACAKVCEEVLEQYRGTSMGKNAELVGDDCAAAIRARGQA
jgi:hypothetical protein